MDILEIGLIEISLAMDAFAVDHWISFILLAIIGIEMIKESFDKNKEENDMVDFKTMIILSIATSIDALAVRNHFFIL